MPGPKPWIKLWKEKLLSSINIRKMRLADKGLYFWLLLTARDDDNLQGHLCYPNGEPISDSDLADECGIKLYRFTERMERFRAAGLVERNDAGAWIMRKYAEHQIPFPSRQDGQKQGNIGAKVGQHLGNIGATLGQAPPDVSSTYDANRLQEAEAEAEAEAEGATNPPSPLVSNSTKRREKRHDTNPTVEYLVRCFDFCGMPGQEAKHRAIEDLVRQGVRPSAIEVYANDPRWRTEDFYAIVRRIRNDFLKDVATQHDPVEEVLQQYRKEHPEVQRG